MSKQVVTVNPATDEVIESFDAMDWNEVSGLMDAAVAAQAAWRNSPLEERVTKLRKLGEVLREDVDFHAALISKEMGKPITEARGEVLKCALACDYYADNLVEFLTPKPVKTEAVNSYVSYEPLGVIFAVMPWNFPYWQVIRFAAPTLAAGNGGMLKHASNVTGSAIAIQHAIEKAGFPKGIFTSLVVADHSMVNQIVEDDRIAAVTLTGSEKAGASVAEAAGRALKKTVLELGGSDPFVILEDADSEAIAPFAVKARFINTGQSCLCAKRFIVADNLVSSEQAIKLANTTQYGLAASIWTKDPSIGVKLGAGISSGALFVNGVVASDPRLPFGGVKLSGYGRELSIEGLHEFMNVRAVWIGNMPTV
ncbi:MAG: hypothetical protein RL101_514 [Actinomycetota bacterium]